MIHFDGKLLPEIVGRGGLVERLPILVTHNGSEQLLGIPKIDGSHGDEIAEAVIFAILDWDLCNSVQAICCDTTSTNSGVDNGACALIEEHLGRDVMWLMCRHHISELLLKEVFQLRMPNTTEPNVPMFVKFHDSWKTLDKTKFNSGMADKKIKKIMNGEEREDIINFCTGQLSKKQCRDDYKEFLELVLKFLDAPDAHKIPFRLPGPMHHARFMSKAIYSLKMFLFRKQSLMKSEENILRDICIFIVRLYVKFWFGCSHAIKAPNQDLQFIKNAIAYEKIDHNISVAVVNKFANHLWYLSDEAAGLAFFDENVPVEVKREMVQRIKYGKPSKGCKRVEITNRTNFRNEFALKNLSEFITPNTRKFFTRFGIKTEFLELDPSTWPKEDDYQEGIRICMNIRVVNDVAERGVRLMTEFNKVLTNKEEEKQFLLQVVSAHRKKYPSPTKKILRT